MSGLPKLPGLSFADPTQTKFHVPHKFGFINGYRIPLPNTMGIGGQELDVQSVRYIKNNDPVRYDPSLTYGRARAPALPQHIPHFALYDQKCLTFKAFFKQSVFESPDEHYRVRQVNIIYFLQDDTITVMEPFIRNCGFKQGRLIRRGHIPKTQAGDFWHWKDLNVGIDICFNGIVFHTVDCDGFTREYMASQGIIINPTEDMPPDPYIQMRELKVRPSTRVTPSLDDKLRRFLEYDGIVLKFFAVWDNRDSEYGSLKKYILHYFLADDTVAVKEVHELNDGCDPVPLLLRKTKLPKNWTDRPVTYPSVYLELSDAEVTEYYQPKDFVIGETIFVLGRRFLLYDCDKFTRKYFAEVLKISQGEPIVIEEEKRKTVGKCMPPHGELGLGTLEDSLQNCFQSIPTRPRRDEIRLILNANKFLRYTMDMDWVHPEDSIRKFILLYSLAQGSCQIFEPPLRNSGILGGKFLKDSLVEKPGSNPYNPDYYTPADFYIGAILLVHGHRFRITGADLAVYRYMQANPEKFSKDVVDNVRNYMFNQGFLTDDIQEKQDENEAIRRKKEIDAIGKELKQIKTEREKCMDEIELGEATFATKTPTESEKFNLVLNKDNLPYSKEICPSGIQPLVKECPYPVRVGDKPRLETENVPCPESTESYTVKYPETEEQKLQKFYDDVLRRHEEACLKAAEYKKDYECLPGTVFKEYDPELSKKILIKKEERPSPEKDSPCVKKTVTFAEPVDACAQEKTDVCGLNVPKTHCDCTTYKKE